MNHSHEEPFENREHIIWEIGFCNKATTYITYLCLVFVAIGINGDLLNMKLGLESMSWLLLAIVTGVMSLAPHLHMIMAKHLLGMEVINRDKV